MPAKSSVIHRTIYDGMQGISDPCTSSLYRVGRCRRALIAYTAPQPWTGIGFGSNDLPSHSQLVSASLTDAEAMGRQNTAIKRGCGLGPRFPASTMLVSDQGST
jgi:hypothetical protein